MPKEQLAAATTFQLIQIQLTSNAGKWVGRSPIVVVFMGCLPPTASKGATYASHDDEQYHLEPYLLAITTYNADKHYHLTMLVNPCILPPPKHQVGIPHAAQNCHSGPSKG